MRATLAHELCKIVVERHATLPLAEVVDGRMLENVARRTRALAAGFFAPKEPLPTRFTNTATKAEALMALRQATEAFDVSAQVVARQVSNRARDVGSVPLPQVDAVLRRARDGY